VNARSGLLITEQKCRALQTNDSQAGSNRKFSLKVQVTKIPKRVDSHGAKHKPRSHLSSKSQVKAV